MKQFFKIYNTETKNVVPFEPRNPDIVTMYTCGPTVYHFAHIGNLRSYIVEDLLEKYMRFIGYNVKRAMNITDVGHLTSDADVGEDKMLVGAKREKKTVMEIAKFYMDAFFLDCKKLNIKKPDIVERATNCIEDYIEMIKHLLKDGFAYISGGNVYFDTSKLDNYYKLSNQNADMLMVGSRDTVTEDNRKRNKTDFVLWFTKSKFDGQELKWESPWGIGYPGWHIECSCIAIKQLGEYLDIHCGGVDNIFPHHTNEIAQSESYLHHEWCKYWFHINHLVLKKGKMSKSSGNILTVTDLENLGYDPIVFRFLCLQSHYRKPLEFSMETFDNAALSYKKLKNRVLKLEDRGVLAEEVLQKYKLKFAESLGDDFNTAGAMGILYEVLKERTSDKTKIAIIKEFENVLSLNLFTEEKIEDLKSSSISYEEKEILQKIKERAIAKKEKRYDDADRIRNELLSINIVLTDTPNGTEWTIKKG